MPRSFKKKKPLIFVFCEGESEQAYTEFLKKEFSDVAVIKKPSSTGLFEDAYSLFQKNPTYRNNAEITDEIWFFFDVEVHDTEKWSQRLKIIKNLRRMRKKPNIRVRLLMTTGCIEYWLMLHYKEFAPPIQTVADKERMLAEVKAQEPNYEKGDYNSTARIARHYPRAIGNADNVLNHLLSDGLPCLEETDDRNKWLITTCKTFSTVYQAIDDLQKLQHTK